jgi:hypothetical protein
MCRNHPNKAPMQKDTPHCGPSLFKPTQPQPQHLPFLMPHPPPMIPPHKRQRRTATSVLAGNFDVPPVRDVLTSVLNSNPYKAVEKSEESKRAKKERKRLRELQKQRDKAVVKTSKAPSTFRVAVGPGAVPPHTAPAASIPPSSTRPLVYQPGRPQINIVMPRSISVTPPPMPLSPASTPGPSESSSTSRTSSKRLHTPMDDEPIGNHAMAFTAFTPVPRAPRKKRPAVRKGWKGWVEGSPPPSTKLINLDSAPILQERRTRNGKSFGAIGEAGWV